MNSSPYLTLSLIKIKPIRLQEDEENSKQDDEQSVSMNCDSWCDEQITHKGYRTGGGLCNHQTNQKKLKQRHAQSC